MTRRTWAQWVAVSAGGWLAIFLGAKALGSDAEPVLLAALVLSVVGFAHIVDDVNEVTDEVDWAPPHRARSRAWGRDARFSRLAQSFTDGSDPAALAVRVHRDLCAVVDHRLASAYAVDRHADPAAARRILGDHLADYLEQPVRHRRGQAARLSALLTRIESL